MKYTLLTLFFLVIIVSGCAFLGGSFTAAQYGADVFEGTGLGYRGPVTVQVRMNGDDIVEIVILDSVEDRLVGAGAIEELKDLVVLYNTTDLDVISGATESSRGFLEAVQNAIMKK